jgi:hypothetical protein
MTSPLSKLSQEVERPILMSAPMVRAILAGTKTQTRRAIKRPERYERIRDCAFCCPYGLPGDRLWVRERIMLPPDITPRMLREGADTWPRCVYLADGWWFGRKRDLGTLSVADYDEEAERSLWRELAWRSVPCIHMPRWASRITLELTDVRVERLQEISQADVIAEGIPTQTDYRRLWDSINGAGSWDANPWVWALTFRRIA